MKRVENGSIREVRENFRRSWHSTKKTKERRLRLGLEDGQGGQGGIDSITVLDGISGTLAVSSDDNGAAVQTVATLEQMKPRRKKFITLILPLSLNRAAPR